MCIWTWTLLEFPDFFLSIQKYNISHSIYWKFPISSNLLKIFIFDKA